jgi:hypothetical protein
MFLPRAGLELRTFYLLLMHTWDYRREAPCLAGLTFQCEFAIWIVL